MPLPHPPPPAGTRAALPRSCPDPSVLTELPSLRRESPATVAPPALRDSRSPVGPGAALSCPGTVTGD